MLDQVKQSWLGPMDVIDHHNEWTAGQRGCLEQAAYGPRDLGGLRCRAGKADGPCDYLGDMSGVGLVVITARGPRCLHEGEDAGPRLVEVVGRGKSSKILNQLCDRPVGDPLAIRQTVTASHPRSPANALDELTDETRLSQPGGCNYRHESARGWQALLEQVVELASSSSRPTIGASRRRWSHDASGVTWRNRQAATGAALPFTTMGTTGSATTAPRTSR
jgi:hypothetical protein